MRTTGDIYLWPAAAERKLRMAYQAGLPAYLYGVTGVASVPSDEIFFCNDRGRRFLPNERTAG